MGQRFGHDYQLTLKMFLQHGVQYAPNQLIKYQDKLTYTYLDQYKRVQQFCNALGSMGLKQGDTIAMLEWDTHRYMEAHWAIPSYGCLFHTVNVRMAPEQIVYCINHAEDKVIFVNEEFLPLIDQIKDQLPTVTTYVIMTDRPDGKIPATKLPNAIEYEAMLAKESDSFDFPELSENTPATLCYTSGTTGNPKGVLFTHRELVMHAIATGFNTGLYQDQMNISSASVYMPLTPMFHVQAWTSPYLFYMLGARYILPGRYDPAKILKQIGDEKVDVICCVATILHMLTFHPDAEKYDLSGLNACVGGAKLTAQVSERCHELGIHAVSYYGMTETGPGMASGQTRHEMYDLPEGEKLTYYQRAGLPWPWCRLRVVDGEDREVPQGEVGEIVVQTPWATHEYYKEPEKTRELWKNDWLHTGDVGFIDDEGYLIVTDRIKDAIKSGGEWISTLTIEDVISTHPAVLECATIGVADSKWGERPLAVITLKQGKTATPEEIREHMLKAAQEGRIEKWWIPNAPEGYVFVDEIPHNFIGKIDKRALRAEFAK